MHYWQPIIERYGIAATVVSDAVDPTFRFMTADWDGKIRMDCSSPYAMARLIGMRDRFDVAFANDTDADRHGIVTRSSGLMNPEPLSGGRDRVSVRATARDWRSDRARRQDHRQQRHHRPRRGEARPQAGRGAGRVQMVRRRPDRRLASASPARKAPARRSCGATDRCGPPTRTGSFWGCWPPRSPREPGATRAKLFDDLTRELGVPFYERIDAPATPEQKSAAEGAVARTARR